MRKILCRLLGHNFKIVSDTGLTRAKAGGCDGDSFLDGNEEALGNYSVVAPLRLREARPVSAREVIFVCSRCGKMERGVTRWCEIGCEDTDLSDESMLEVLHIRLGFEKEFGK
jgi:hypothetical protein